MRVLVLGGYGLIGAAIVARLLVAGHAVIALGRDVEAAQRREPRALWMEHDLRGLLSPEAWSPFLAGIEAVVNCVGALQDGARDDVRSVQRDAMLALFAACEREGSPLVVQVSAAGASVDAGTPFMSTKGEADAALACTSLRFIIVRPGLVIAPTAYGGTALVRALASTPLLTPIVGGTEPIQTVPVEEVADAVLLSVEGRVPFGRSYDLVEPEPLTFPGLGPVIA